MEKIGLISKFIELNSVNFTSAALVESSKEKQSLNKNLTLTLQVLKNIVTTKDIVLILEAEKITLRLELEKRANSPEEANSIKIALLQMEEAQQSLSVVKNASVYQAVAATYSSKRKEAGLPLDSFREFLKSHTTRLTNRLAGPLSVPEKNILRQRKENLRVVKEVYMGMQREALGLGQEKDYGQEMER